jgi:prevent-host-death family protein
MPDQTVNIQEAKTHFSRLIAQVRNGKRVIIAKGGKPVAQLVPLEQGRPVRTPGFLKGRIRIAADFDAPLPPEVTESFFNAS